MTKSIQVTSEVVRLTQKTAELHSLPFHKQVARCLVEQAITDLDPELNFLLDSESALSSINAVVRTTQANDVVVNGRHIDVRALEGNEVRLSAALAGTSYIECGSLVVELADTGRGAIVGYIEPKRWESASQNAEANDVVLPFKAEQDFDLAECLKKIEETHSAAVDKEPAVQPKTEDILRFARNPRELTLDGQRAVIAAALSSQRIRENIEALDKFAADKSPRILRDASAWESRVQRIADKIANKFPQLPQEKILATARQIGEQFGGQTDAHAYREALSKAIARQHLANRVSSRAKKLMDPLIDGVAAGKSATDAIKSVLKNAVAVDLAAIIQKKRSAVEQYAQLTAQEIGYAFQQLQLQPAYATHSQDETTGVDAINDALELLDAASVVEGLMNIDFDKD